MELSRQLSHTQNIAQLKNELPSEPSKGTRGVTKLKVRLGSGKPIMRSFEKETPIRIVRNWVLIEMSKRDDINIVHFRINCNMPKRSYGSDDICENDTLETTGLHPSAMLYVQDMDS